MNSEDDYPYKEKNTEGCWIAFFLLLFVIVVLIGAFFAIKWWVIPNLVSIINWFVPNFWSLFIGIVFLWILFKIASFIWYPIYSMLGKYSYLILLATLIYILMQINAF